MECLGTKAVTGFAEEILRETGTDVRQCYQCAKCTAGCPTSHAMDNPPSRIMQMAKLGLRDAALKSESIWLCVGCETCSARCPKELEPSKVMKALAAIAALEDVPVEDTDVREFHRTFLNWVRRLGRLYEPGLIGELKLRTGNLFQDLGLGMAMGQRGKLRPLPHIIKGRRAVAEMFEHERGGQEPKAEESDH